MAQTNDIFARIEEWKRKYYEDTCDPSHTEKYNGCAIEIRFLCQCDEVDDPVCGDKFFVISEQGKIYTNGYLYYKKIQAINTAREAVDNGECP